MKRRWFQSIIVLGAIAVLSLAAYAADTPNPRFSAKVKVSVGGEESIKSSVSSYLNRELRSLGDVEIVDDNYEWAINITALENKIVGGKKSGFTIAAIFIQSFNNQLLRELVEPKHQDFVIKMTSGLSYYPDGWVVIGGPESLQELCKKIIADFDTECLEKVRKPTGFINRKAK